MILLIALAESRVIEMHRILAISADIPQFKANRILDRQWAMRFPGASWIPLLNDYLHLKFEVVTADVALSHVLEAFRDPRDILVIQHGDDPITRELILRGSKPLAITCLESPIYAAEFYDHLQEIAKEFAHRILFSEAPSIFSDKDGTHHHLRFPSYFLDDLNAESVPWNQRKCMVAVIGNKYVVPHARPPGWQLSELLWWARRRASYMRHRPYQSSRLPVQSIQLQDARLELISFFHQRGELDLFGQGWTDLRNLPPRWRQVLTESFSKAPPLPCENKLATIRGYRFCLCVENARFPGYVTEKLLDCLVAGVVPLYLGAPDIEKYFPAKCFIDLRKYRSSKSLLEELQSMSEDAGMSIIEHGRDFLASDAGRAYSYEGFARFISELVREEVGVKP